MRITNQMSTNRLLLNVNRNARKVDNLYTQISSGKKIQFPSDDPIIASRALKFRTNISETEQYMRNASQASSWMGVSEEGISNMLDLLSSIRERLVQGDTDTLTIEDRDKIVTEMRSLAAQIGGEMNVTYAGRYVFSGYRTNYPPVITIDDAAASFDITQTIAAGDIQQTKAYVAGATTSPPTNVSETQVYNITKIDLPYKDEDGRSVTVNGGIDVYDKDNALIGNITVVVKNETDADRYDIATNVPAGAGAVAYYIPETGEMILSEDAASMLKSDSGNTAKINYTVNGLKEGDLNPVVYFDCVDNNTGKAYNMDDQQLKFEFGINTQIQINNLAKDVYTASLYGELMNFIDEVSKASLPNKDDVRAMYAAAGFTGEALDTAVNDFMTDETKKFTEYLNEAFSNTLGRFDGHTSGVLREYTTLGSRINRIDLTKERLEQNRVSYTTLMSDNENIDYLEAIMQFSAAEAVYNASMNIGARISQLTLADYIR